jgi:hypothetical protein
VQPQPVGGQQESGVVQQNGGNNAEVTVEMGAPIEETMELTPEITPAG